MQQHPVPQDITTYQFRLVGDMTLKQFLFLGAGILGAVLIYSSGLPFFFKWPLLGVSGLAGIAFAFLPFQERPLDIWVVNFFKSIYSPTRFLWKKQEKIPDFLSYTPHAPKGPEPVKISDQDRAKYGEYLKSLPAQGPQNNLDKMEKEVISSISKLLEDQDLEVKPTDPVVNITPDSGTTPVVKMAENFAPFLEVEKEKRVNKPLPKTLPAKPLPIINIPAVPMPETANAVVGIVKDNQGQILTGAIIEIRDKNQMPVRASRSNKLGQFFIATPLPNGEYEVEAEHPQLSFAIMKLIASGKIIPPLEIKATG